MAVPWQFTDVCKDPADPGYLCTLESRRRTQIPTTRKGKTWVHLRSPRWAMLSWYFTWKDRIGDCLGTRVNICVCCQNKNRRAHKQNKGYTGAMPGGLNREMCTCTHTHTHVLRTLTAHLFPLFRKTDGMRDPGLATFIKKICQRQGTRPEPRHCLARWEILPRRNRGLRLDWKRDGDQ